MAIHKGFSKKEIGMLKETLQEDDAIKVVSEGNERSILHSCTAREKYTL